MSPPQVPISNNTSQAMPDAVVLHLAVRMVKPTHLLLAGYQDWRWGRPDDVLWFPSTSPWYPTLSIYRGDPSSSVARIASTLTLTLAARPTDRAPEARAAGIFDGFTKGTA